MSEQTFLVAYDGHDRDVIDAAAVLSAAVGAGLVVVHVLPWSPYSFIAPDETAARHKTRQEDLKRAEDAVVGPVVAALKSAGHKAEGIVLFGQPADVIIDQARARKATLVFVGRSSSFSSRMFGSVTSALSQECPVPVVIVP